MERSRTRTYILLFFVLIIGSWLIYETDLWGIWTRVEKIMIDIKGNPEKKVIRQMVEISKVLELYKLDNGKYPTTEQGLQALVEEPKSEPIPKNWKQYLDKIPRDPWKQEYVYLCPGSNHGEKIDKEAAYGKYGYYDMICYGPDGIESEDDIVRWDLPQDR